MNQIVEAHPDKPWENVRPHVVHLNEAGRHPCQSVVGCALSSRWQMLDENVSGNRIADKKTTDGALNKRDNYDAKQITIHDNRGICAHAGYCTENLSSVFKLDEEPWIDPDGATVKDIIRTISKCPSGALSYTVDNVEHRDQDREPMVTVTKDGPYAITGGIELIDQPLGEGASTEHYTLCRCGGSKNKPFCDGTHWHIGFKDEKN